ncbi:hypothetical protein P7K49_032300, partial [Saguinus oedipus]
MFTRQFKKRVILEQLQVEKAEGMASALQVAQHIPCAEAETIDQPGRWQEGPQMSRAASQKNHRFVLG